MWDQALPISRPLLNHQAGVDSLVPDIMPHLLPVRNDGQVGYQQLER
jgi:hypothetical protein